MTWIFGRFRDKKMALNPELVKLVSWIFPGMNLEQDIQSLIFYFTINIEKSYKQSKVLQDCMDLQTCPASYSSVGNGSTLPV
jgi:hypothetical protein